MFTTLNLKSQTIVGGNISTNTTWSSLNSPYIVTSNLIVDSATTLTIEPNVVVQLDTGKFIRINGTLIAIGTISDSISFVPHLTGNDFSWGYLEFANSSNDAVFNETNYLEGSVLEFCNIKYAGISNYNAENKAAIILRNAHPFINHCNISHNYSTGIIGLNLDDTLKIQNNHISFNTSTNFDYNNAGGIYITGIGQIFISENEIFNNTASQSNFQNNAGGIYASSYSHCEIINNKVYNNISPFSLMNPAGGILTESNNAFVSNNFIYGNHCEGGALGSGAGGIKSLAITNAKNNIIYNNSAIDGAGGAFLYYESQLENNVIVNNSSENYAGGVGVIYGTNIYRNVIAENNNSNGVGGGIHWWGCCGSYSLNNNQIVNNSAKDASAVYFDAGTQAMYNNTITQNNNTDTSILPDYTLLIKKDYSINNNNIFNNNAGYELYNYEIDTTYTVNVENNWWGSETDSIIRTKIYNWTDTAVLGVVNYDPFLLSANVSAPISTPYGLTKTNLGGGQVKLTWHKNPESDFNSFKIYYGTFNGYSFSNSLNVGLDTSYIFNGISIFDTLAVTALDNSFNELNDYDSTIVNDNMVYGHESWYAFAKPNCVGFSVSFSSNNASCSSCNDGNLTAIVNGGLSPYDFYWHTNPIQNTPTASNLAPGKYMVTISDFNGCAYSDSIEVGFSTGLSYYSSKSRFTIYPIPAKNIITIKQNDESPLFVKIHNALGNLVYNDNFKHKENIIDVSMLNEGIYIIELNNGSTIEKRKIIIQH